MSGITATLFADLHMRVGGGTLVIARVERSASCVRRRSYRNLSHQLGWWVDLWDEARQNRCGAGICVATIGAALKGNSSEVNPTQTGVPS